MGRCRERPFVFRAAVFVCMTMLPSLLVAILRRSAAYLRSASIFAMLESEQGSFCRAVSYTGFQQPPTLRQSIYGHPRTLVPSRRATFAIDRLALEHYRLKMRRDLAAQDRNEGGDPSPNQQHHRNCNSAIHQVVIGKIFHIAVEERTRADEQDCRDYGSHGDTLPIQSLARDEAIDQKKRSEKQQYANQLDDKGKSGASVARQKPNCVPQEQEKIVRK